MSTRAAMRPHPTQSPRRPEGAGWGAGQLDMEISTGSWLPLPTAADLVFADGAAEEVWRAAIRRLGGGGASLAHLPPDPTWN